VRGIHTASVSIGTCLLAVASVVMLSGDEPSWKQKPILQWDDQDAKDVLADSPWVKNSKLQKVRYLSEYERRDSGNWEAGIAARDGLGFDLAPLLGLFGENNASMVYELSRRLGPEPGNTAVRWESARPVRAAELKAGETDAPVWQGDYYAIAVYDIPAPFRWNLAPVLKGLASLQREKKKDVKPSRVQILHRNDGRINVVYLFPLSAEISRKDASVHFVAQIGSLVVSQFFYPNEMRLQGEPEL
jgi:hypothetical protein